MKIETKKLEELKFPEKNVRRHPKSQIEELMRSLKKFGQYRPAIIDENNTILVGNGMVMALQEMGVSEIRVHRINGLSDNDKSKLMLADNKIHNLGTDNLDSIYEIIGELSGDYDIPGYDETVLESMFASEEEVTKQLVEYGKVNEEDRKWVKERTNEVENVPPRRGDAQTDDKRFIDDSMVTGKVVEKPVQTESDKVAIECPYCGETIWL